jgi:hypothetical protein
MSMSKETSPGHPVPPSPDELLAEKKDRRALLMAHARLGGMVSAVLIAFDTIRCWGDDDATMWSLYLVALWAVGLAIHAVRFTGWAEEHRVGIEIESSFRRVGPGGRPLGLLAEPRDAEWKRLWSRLEDVHLAVDRAVDRLGAGGVEARGELQACMDHVQAIFDGASRLQHAMDIPGMKVDANTITEAGWRVERAETDRLRSLYQANLDLLKAQKSKVEALKQDLKRMRVCVEGFLIAAENMHLDASRLQASGELPMGSLMLGDARRDLEDEVLVLRQVEEELERLES